MGQRVEMIKKQLSGLFPQLSSDKFFDVTSPQDPNYNCIAWAYNYKDRWMWPGGEECGVLDGFHYWPDGVADDVNVDNFIDAFRLKGYEICGDASYEHGFIKIALYVKPGTKECTHAARQKTNTYWTSKLGSQYDIQHGTPYTIEGAVYGDVYCIMKREFK